MRQLGLFATPKQAGVKANMDLWGPSSRTTCKSRMDAAHPGPDRSPGEGGDPLFKKLSKEESNLLFHNLRYQGDPQLGVSLVL